MNILSWICLGCIVVGMTYLFVQKEIEISELERASKKLIKEAERMQEVVQSMRNQK